MSNNKFIKSKSPIATKNIVQLQILESTSNPNLIEGVPEDHKGEQEEDTLVSYSNYNQEQQNYDANEQHNSQLEYQQQQDDGVSKNNTSYQNSEEGQEIDEGAAQFISILEEVLERQNQMREVFENGDSELPLVDENMTSYQAMCQGLNLQLAYALSAYKELRQKQSLKHVVEDQRSQLLQEHKDKLQQLLRKQEQSTEQKDKHIQQLLEELSSCKRQLDGHLMMYESTVGNSSSGAGVIGENHRHAINQNQDFCHLQSFQQPQLNDSVIVSQYNREFRDKDELISYQKEVIMAMEKELQHLREQEEEKDSQIQRLNIQLMNRPGSNILSLSESGDEGYDGGTTHEVDEAHLVQLSQAQKIVNEKDAIIMNLQNRITKLLGNNCIQLNVHSHDISTKICYDYYQGGQQSSMVSPQKKGQSRASPDKRDRQYRGIAPFTNQSPQKLQFKAASKDIRVTAINQAQIIDELLKKKTISGGGNVNANRDTDLWIKLEELNLEYVELIKRFKLLEKEKIGMQKLIDELMAVCNGIDSEFHILFKQVSDNAQLRQKQLQIDMQKKKLPDILIEHEVEDFGSLLEYIELLFEEKQYQQGGQLWLRIGYENLMKTKYAKNIDYLKILLKIRDEVIKQLLDQLKLDDDEEGKLIGPDKVNFIINQFMREKQDNLRNLEKSKEELVAKNKDVADQLEKLQRKLVLVIGERDFEKKKNEKLKNEINDLGQQLADGEEQSHRNGEKLKELTGLQVQLRQLSRANQELDAANKELEDRLAQVSQIGEEQMEQHESRILQLQKQNVQDQLESEEQFNKTKLDYENKLDAIKKEKSKLIEQIQQLEDEKAELQQELSNANGEMVRAEQYYSSQIAKAGSKQIKNQPLSGSSSQQQSVASLKTIKEEKKNDSRKSSNSSQLNNGTGGFNNDSEDDTTTEGQLRIMYRQFFSQDFKLAQDKVKNKNSIFKKMYQYVCDQLKSLQDSDIGVKQQIKKSKKNNEELQNLNDDLNKQLKSAKKGLINLIIGLEQNSSSTHKNDLTQLKVAQLIEILEQLVKDIGDKQHSKKTVDKKVLNLKVYDSEFETDTDNVTREEALEQLRIISMENQQLLERAQSLNEQLTEIADKATDLSDDNKRLETINQELIQKLAYYKTMEHKTRQLQQQQHHSNSNYEYYSNTKVGGAAKHGSKVRSEDKRQTSGPHITPPEKDRTEMSMQSLQDMRSCAKALKFKGANSTHATKNSSLQNNKHSEMSEDINGGHLNIGGGGATYEDEDDFNENAHLYIPQSKLAPYGAAAAKVTNHLTIYPPNKYVPLLTKDLDQAKKGLKNSALDNDSHQLIPSRNGLKGRALLTATHKNHTSSQFSFAGTENDVEENSHTKYGIDRPNNKYDRLAMTQPLKNMGSNEYYQHKSSVINGDFNNGNRSQQSTSDAMIISHSSRGDKADRLQQDYMRMNKQQNEDSPQYSYQQNHKGQDEEVSMYNSGRNQMLAGNNNSTISSTSRRIISLRQPKPYNTAGNNSIEKPQLY